MPAGEGSELTEANSLLSSGSMASWLRIDGSFWSRCSSSRSLCLSSSLPFQPLSTGLYRALPAPFRRSKITTSAQTDRQTHSHQFTITLMCTTTTFGDNVSQYHNALNYTLIWTWPSKRNFQGGLTIISVTTSGGSLYIFWIHWDPTARRFKSHDLPSVLGLRRPAHAHLWRGAVPVPQQRVTQWLLLALVDVGESQHLVGVGGGQGKEGLITSDKRLFFTCDQQHTVSGKYIIEFKEQILGLVLGH